MTSDVSLTAALRNNLLSLKSAGQNETERVKDSSGSLLQAQQEAGKSESSGNTQDSVFAASALNSRASALTNILDGLSESIQVIKAADQGLESLSGLLNEAGDILQSAIQNGESQELVSQYNNVLQRIDSLVSSPETGFRGTNLLNGDNLNSAFNEDRSTSLLTQGRILSSHALDLSQLDFPGAPVENAIANLRAAQNEVQSYDSALGGDLSIIQTRRDFTQNLIGTLTEGANNISVSGQSEEGATLLALNTKQQLEGSNLSLASQSQESILRFF